MLKYLRQGGFIKGLMGGVVLLIIASFALDLRGPGPGVSASDCVVEVDGSCVTTKDYHTLLRLVGPSGASDKELAKRGFAQHAINALIERELLLKEARRLGVSISKEQLDAELAQGRVHYSWPVDAPLPGALAQGYPFPLTGAGETVTYLRVRNSKTDAFDYEIYRRQVQGLLRMSPREFKDKQEFELIAARVRALVTSPVRVAEDEAFAAFERQKSSAVVRSVDVETSWFERFAVESSDAVAEAFQNANAERVNEVWETQKDAWKADCPLVAELSFPFAPGADEDDRKELETKAKEVAKLNGPGVPFASLVQAFGSGPRARAGGALGCLDAEAYGAGSDVLLEAVSKLAPGAVSGLLETPRGFHLVQFLGKLSAEEAERRGKLEVARGLAIEEAAKHAARAFAQQLIDAAKGGTELSAAVEQALVASVRSDGLPAAFAAALAKAAKESDDIPEFEVGRSFNRAGNPVPGLKQRDVGARVFALPEPDALIEEPLETYAGFVVLQLKEKTLATREEFDADKAALIDSLKEQKRSEALSSYLNRLRERTTRIAVHPAYDPAKMARDGLGGIADEANEG